MSKVKRVVTWVAYKAIQPFCFILTGHDFYNGGEWCRDCHAPRPQGWKP